MDLKDIRTTITKDRIWFGFPHYVVLGWALLVSYTLYSTVERLDDHLIEGRNAEARIDDSIATMANAIKELQAHTQVLRDDAVRTRMILELKFPHTARQVDDAFEPETP